MEVSNDSVELILKAICTVVLADCSGPHKSQGARAPTWKSLVVTQDIVHWNLSGLTQDILYMILIGCMPLLHLDSYCKSHIKKVNVHSLSRPPAFV